MSWSALPPEIREIAEAELSPRQLEVLKLRLGGLTIRDTANALGIAPSTVTSHIWRIKQKVSPVIRREAA